ncbi:hypothetical protein RhiirC2_803592 [Rhizophagus irregularis]|uniref:Uncharacterized protein n=1 Tax=Rhizophagus irregularis TaxID=588596 RepID=A0A2N1LFK7_9GLOM|nr:hypothetical protein RhiirC2_803592 [Rhizophagus irregularis]
MFSKNPPNTRTRYKTVLNIEFLDTSKFLSAIPLYNKNFTESVKAETKFSIDVDVPTPNELPLFYSIIVGIGENLDKDAFILHISLHNRH